MSTCYAMPTLQFSVKGYPVIDGRLELTNLTLIGFTQPASCSYNVFVIGNNPVSPDAVHPVEMRGTVKVDVPNDNIAHFYPPNEEWINQEVFFYLSLITLLSWSVNSNSSNEAYICHFYI